MIVAILFVSNFFILSCHENSLSNTVIQNSNRFIITEDFNTKIDTSKFYNQKRTYCQYQNLNQDIGIGLLFWDGDCETKIKFYDDSSMQTFHEYSLCDSIIPFCPIFYKPDYSIFSLVVLNQNKNYYKILVNDTETKFLHKTNSFEFMKWDHILIDEATGVRLINEENVLTVKSVKGDYINVYDEDNKKNRTIKWVENNKLKIEIMFLM